MMPVLQNAKKILLVSPHRLGDTLFATPGIRALRQALPHSQIDVIALSSISYEVLKANPNVNHVYEAKDCSIESFAVQYDVVLALQNIKKMQEYLKMVPNVLLLPPYPGTYHYSEDFYRFIVKQLPEASAFPLGPYEINWTEKDDQYTNLLLESVPRVPRPFILAIHMGCHRIAKGESFLYKLFPFLMTKGSRSWSIQCYKQLINRLFDQYPQAYVVLTGALSESYIAKGLCVHKRMINVIGKTNVAELASLLQQCDVVLTGDTGPMHIGSAVDMPILFLCGKTDPAQTGPYSQTNQHTIIREKSMESISVDIVYEAVTNLI